MLLLLLLLRQVEAEVVGKGKVGRGKEEAGTREWARQRRGSMARLAGAMTMMLVGKGEKGNEMQALIKKCLWWWWR
eukprot:evm.model.NODE_24100_length_2102_cov_27.135109.1